MAEMYAGPLPTVDVDLVCDLCQATVPARCEPLDWNNAVPTSDRWHNGVVVEYLDDPEGEWSLTLERNGLLTTLCPGCVEDARDARQAEAAREIASMLDGQYWGPDVIDGVVEVLRRHGFEMRDTGDRPDYL